MTTGYKRQGTNPLEFSHLGKRLVTPIPQVTAARAQVYAGPLASPWPTSAERERETRPARPGAVPGLGRGGGGRAG